MVEMFGEFLQALIGKIREGKLTEASQALANAYDEYLHKTAGEILQIPAEKLIVTLKDEHEFNEQQIEIVAGLLQAEAELRFKQEHFKDSKDNFQKALLLLNYLDLEEKTFSFDRQNRIKEIEEKIAAIKT